MNTTEIKKYHAALHTALDIGKDSPHQIAKIQIELAGQAAYTSEKLKTLRNNYPEFFLSKKKERDENTGKPYSNEYIEILWRNETNGGEISLKNDLEVFDRFLAASKGAMIALSIESKVQE